MKIKNELGFHPSLKLMSFYKAILMGEAGMNWNAVLIIELMLIFIQIYQLKQQFEKVFINYSRTLVIWINFSFLCLSYK